MCWAADLSSDLMSTLGRWRQSLTSAIQSNLLRYIHIMWHFSDTTPDWPEKCEPCQCWLFFHLKQINSESCYCLWFLTSKMQTPTQIHTLSLQDKMKKMITDKKTHISSPNNDSFSRNRVGRFIRNKNKKIQQQQQQREANSTATEREREGIK